MLGKIYTSLGTSYQEGRLPYAAYVAEIIKAMDRGKAKGFISAIAEMEILVKPLRERDVAAQERI